jgi:hypothetical protein
MLSLKIRNWLRPGVKSYWCTVISVNMSLGIGYGSVTRAQAGFFGRDSEFATKSGVGN